MKFWIVTPSYNQVEWLKLCVDSVADQVATQALGIGHSTSDIEHEAGTPEAKSQKPKALSLSQISVHHHVQDACSTDGTVEFLQEYASEVVDAMPPSRNQQTSDEGVAGALPRYASTKKKDPSPNAYSFSFASETDEGMYDAINRGWKLAPDDVDVIAHLNCDEQYLPNALQTIAAFFKAHQEADVVLADMIVVDKDGSCICHRRSLKPYAFFSKHCCAGMTATTFHRASVTKEKGVFFDTSWRNFGDKVWYNALHTAGCRFNVFNHIVSVFADTGDNLNWTGEGLDELERYNQTILRGNTLPSYLISKFHSFRRLLKEIYLTPPASYSIYTGMASRSNRIILKPTGFWHKKWKR